MRKSEERFHGQHNYLSHDLGHNWQPFPQSLVTSNLINSIGFKLCVCPCKVKEKRVVILEDYPQQSKANCWDTCAKINERLFLVQGREGLIMRFGWQVYRVFIKCVLSTVSMIQVGTNSTLIYQEQKKCQVSWFT